VDEVKSIIFSKTFWFNVISLGLEVSQVMMDMRIVPTEQMAVGIAVGNIVLRYITKTPVSLTGK